MLFSDYAADYLSHIKHERKLSARTFACYQSHLHQFQGWLADNGYPAPTLAEAFTTPVLRRYLYSLSERGLRPRSIRSCFHPLRGLGVFLEENGVIKNSPARTVTMPKKDAAKRLLVSSDELTALLEAVERQRSPFDVALSRAMFSVLIYCGLRASELLDLKVEHINLSDKTLLVACGKGSKSRLLYPPQECLEAITEWLAMRPKDNRTDWLWAYGKERRVAEHGLRSMLETVKAIAGLADRNNIKPHSIRHAFATRLMHKGADIKSIQAALGHSEAATTLIYLHAAEQPAKAMAELASLGSGLSGVPSTNGKNEATPDAKQKRGNETRRNAYAETQRRRRQAVR